MKIGVLTSSRADYSIYFPLLKALQQDPHFELDILAFGTHLSPLHGDTLQYILRDGFEVKHALRTISEGDDPTSITLSMAKTMECFAAIWSSEQYDVVFALGDRYEMFSAVASGVPFNIFFAHIHGGETTLGAIDDVFRHSITHMSQVHFATTDIYKNRVAELKGSNTNVFNVGALSIDNLASLNLLSIVEFKSKFNIDLKIPSILITFHPETVSFEKNKEYVAELIKALEQLSNYQLIITMPNNDTMGRIIREKLNEFINIHSNAIGVENFGTLGYLSCIKHCAFMLGNTSSGFVEASYFPKYVINLGDRQKGRILTPNIISIEIKQDRIIEAVKYVEVAPKQNNIETYGNGTSAASIIASLKKMDR